MKKSVREILEKVRSPILCCNSCKEDKHLGFGDDIDGCCCRHISVDQALNDLAELVLGEKKPAGTYFPADRDHALWNSCCLHIAKLIRGEK